jgi:hypothetical protein
MAEVEQAFGKAVAVRKMVRRAKKNDEDANEQAFNRDDIDIHIDIHSIFTRR